MRAVCVHVSACRGTVLSVLVCDHLCLCRECTSTGPLHQASPLAALENGENRSILSW